MMSMGEDYDGERSDLFQTSMGVRQGCILIPLFFCVNTNGFRGDRLIWLDGGGRGVYISEKVNWKIINLNWCNMVKIKFN